MSDNKNGMLASWSLTKYYKKYSILHPKKYYKKIINITLKNTVDHFLSLKYEIFVKRDEKKAQNE